MHSVCTLKGIYIIEKASNAFNGNTDLQQQELVKLVNHNEASIRIRMFGYSVGSCCSRYYVTQMIAT